MTEIRSYRFEEIMAERAKRRAIKLRQRRNEMIRLLLATAMCAALAVIGALLVAALSSPR
jgi:hypothetical protein